MAVSLTAAWAVYQGFVSQGVEGRGTKEGKKENQTLRKASQMKVVTKEQPFNERQGVGQLRRTSQAGKQNQESRENNQEPISRAHIWGPQRAERTGQLFSTLTTGHVWREGHETALSSHSLTLIITGATPKEPNVTQQCDVHLTCHLPS